MHDANSDTLTPSRRNQHGHPLVGSNRETQSEGIFVEQTLIPEFLETRPVSTLELAGDYFRVFATRFSIGIAKTLPGIAFIVGGLITLATALLKPILDLASSNSARTELLRTISWLQFDWSSLIIVAGMVLTGIGTLLCFSMIGAALMDERFMTTWSSASIANIRARKAANHAARLLKDPAYIFRLVPRNRCLVLLVNDVDLMDNRSIIWFADLAIAAKQSAPWSRLFMVLGFDPRNPLLRLSERSLAAEFLIGRPDRDVEPFWTDRLLVRPLSPADVPAVMAAYIGGDAASRLVRVVSADEDGQLYPPERLLSFFAQLDEDTRLEGKKLAVVSEHEVVAALRIFGGRRDTEIEQLIRTISSSETTGQAIMCLKLVLAFFGQKPMVDDVTAIMRSLGYRKNRVHDQALVEEPVGVLRKRQGHYEFREAWLTASLRAAWPEWRDRAEELATLVFEQQHGRGKWEPEQAIRSAPSKAAIEVLYIQGLYHFDYYGQSDAGTVIRYLGIDRGGALEKWLDLLREAGEDHNDGSSLWDHVYWRRTTDYNPYKTWGKSVANQHHIEWLFGPDLLVRAAEAYWLAGLREHAIDLLRNTWNSIQSQLPASYPADWEDNQIRTCTEYIRLTRAGVELLLSKILHHHGLGDSWSEALNICTTLSRTGSRTPLHQADARLRALMIKHYRECGSGLAWPPLRFGFGSAAPELIAAAQDASGSDLMRLRAFHVICEPLWQQKWPEGLSTEFIDGESFALIRKAAEMGIDLVQAARDSPDAPFPAVLGGGRIADAELFLWEGLFLLTSCLVSLQSVLREYQKTGGFGVALSKNALLSDEGKQAVASQLNTLKHQLPATVDRVATTQNVRNALQNILYVVSLEADEHLGYADTLYRRIDHRPGRSEILFRRALIRRVAPAPTGGADHETLMDQSRDAEELGFHGDALYANLLDLSPWDQDLLRMTFMCERAKRWVREPCLEMQPMVAARLNFIEGHLSTLAGGSETHRKTLFDSAIVGYEQFRSSPVVKNSDIPGLETELALCRWYAASLDIASATTLQSPAANLRTAREHISWLLNFATQNQDAHIEFQSRFLAGMAAKAENNWRECADQWQTCIDHFRNVNDEFWLLQMQRNWIDLLITTTPDGQAVSDLLSIDTNAAYQEMKSLCENAEAAFRRHDRLSNSYLSQLRYAVENLAEYYSRLDAHEESLRWYVLAFDLLMTLGLVTKAVLLDEQIKPLLGVIRSGQARRDHDMRMLSAAPQIRPIPGEDLSAVGRVLRIYFGEAAPDSIDRPEKLELVRAAAEQLRGGNVDGAVEVLRRGVPMVRRLEPEELDVRLLGDLALAYRGIGDPVSALQLENFRDEVRDRLQSQDFLALAKAYVRRGRSPKWALRIATEVRFKESQAYREAYDLLGDLESSDDN